MKTEDIVKAAEERLAEIEAEAAKLKAIIAAAKGPSIAPFIPVPVLPPIEVRPFVYPFAQEPPIEYEWVRKSRKYKMTPSWQTPFDNGAFDLRMCEGVIDWVASNGVRPSDDGFVIGGPQRMDPNVRFAS